MTFGLIQTHNQMNVLAQELFAAAAQTRALASLLAQRGLISEEEYEAQRRKEEAQLAEHFSQRKVGERMSDLIPDKYALPADELPQIDCASRYHLCHAACCSLRFALTRQDLVEGFMRWELSEPYLNRQGFDRRCVHLDRGTLHCSIYDHRPGICRAYDCRQDKRIWQDFEQAIINPDLFVYDEQGNRFITFTKQEDDEQAPDVVADSMEQAPS
ncbi:MAG TPA: YkgJ family cysteine cluster protein [Chloroflexota bacterium]|nr:YkgJ family cysteine cluster protein [Chloroflexota bacterium]